MLNNKENFKQLPFYKKGDLIQHISQILSTHTNIAQLDEIKSLLLENFSLDDTDLILLNNPEIQYILVTNESALHWLIKQDDLLNKISPNWINTIFKTGASNGTTVLSLLANREWGLDFILNTGGEDLAINITTVGLNATISRTGTIPGATALFFLAHSCKGILFLNTYGKHLAPKITDVGLNTLITKGFKILNSSSLFFLTQYDKGLEFLNTYGKYLAPKITPAGLNAITSKNNYGQELSALHALVMADSGLKFLNTYGEQLAPKITVDGLNTITIDKRHAIGFSVLSWLTMLYDGLDFLNTYGKYLAPKISAIGLNTIMGLSTTNHKDRPEALNIFVNLKNGLTTLAILSDNAQGCEFLNTYAKYLIPKLAKEELPPNYGISLKSDYIIMLVKKHLAKKSFTIALLLIKQLIMYDTHEIYQDTMITTFISEHILLNLAKHSLVTAEAEIDKVADQDFKYFLKAHIALKKEDFLTAYNYIQNISNKHVLDKTEVEKIRTFLFDKTNVSVRKDSLAQRLIALISTHDTLTKRNFDVEINAIKHNLTATQQILCDLIAYSEQCENNGKILKRNQSSHTYRQELERVNKKIVELNILSKTINELLTKYLTTKEIFEGTLNGISQHNTWLLIEAGELKDLQKAENFILILENKRNQLSKIKNNFAEKSKGLIEYAEIIKNKLEAFSKIREHIKMQNTKLVANDEHEKIIKEIESVESQIKLLQATDLARQKINTERREKWQKQRETFQQNKIEEQKLLAKQKEQLAEKKRHKFEQKEKQKTDCKHRQIFLKFASKLPNLSDYIEREQSRHTLASSIQEISYIQQQLSQLPTNQYLEAKLDILLGICVETMEKIKKLPKINPLLKKISRKLRNVLYHGDMNGLLNTYTEAALPQFIDIFCHILKNHLAFTTLDTIQNYFEPKVEYQAGFLLFQAMSNYVIDDKPKIKRHQHLAKLQTSLDNTMKQIAIYESEPLTSDSKIQTILSPAIRYQYGKLSAFFKKLKQNFKSEYDELAKMLPVSQYRNLGNNLRHGNTPGYYPSGLSLTSAAAPDHSAAREDKWDSDFKF